MKKIKSTMIIAAVLAVTMSFTACSKEPTAPATTPDTGIDSASSMVPEVTPEVEETGFTQAKAEAKVQRLLDVHTELVEIAQTDEVAKQVVMMMENYSMKMLKTTVMTKDGRDLNGSGTGTLSIGVNYFFDRVNSGLEHYDFNEYITANNAYDMMLKYLPDVDVFRNTMTDEEKNSARMPMAEAPGLINYMNKDGFTFNELQPVEVDDYKVYGSTTAYSMTINVGENKDELIALFNADEQLINIIPTVGENFDTNKYILTF